MVSGMPRLCRRCLSLFDFEPRANCSVCVASVYHAADARLVEPTLADAQVAGGLDDVEDAAVTRVCVHGAERYDRSFGSSTARYPR